MTRTVLISLSALGLLVALMATPAEAQSRRELAARLDAVEARLAEIESRALQGDPVAETLMMRVDDLERQQRVQTGEIERLNFENRRLRQELEQMGVNVDRLLSGGAVYGSGDADRAAGGDPSLWAARPIFSPRTRSMTAIRSPRRGPRPCSLWARPLKTRHPNAPRHATPGPKAAPKRSSMRMSVRSPRRPSR